MKIEYEVKILDIIIDDTKKILENLGATYKGCAMQKRYVYDFKPVCYEKRVRLRSNGTTTTLCIKEIIDEGKIEGMKELEVEVSDFDATHAILNQLGYTARAYQENRRSSYSLDGCNIEIDEWPLIPPYVEIEGPNKASVEIVLGKLGLVNHIITSENTTAVYKRYGINDLESIEHLSFNE